jgi:hypothetical protein
MPAKYADGKEIARGELVRIREMSGNTAVVARKLTIDDLEALESDLEALKINDDKLQKGEKSKNE